MQKVILLNFEQNDQEGGKWARPRYAGPHWNEQDCSHSTKMFMKYNLGLHNALPSWTLHDWNLKGACLFCIFSDTNSNRTDAWLCATPFGVELFMIEIWNDHVCFALEPMDPQHLFLLKEGTWPIWNVTGRLVLSFQTGSGMRLLAVAHQSNIIAN